MKLFLTKTGDDMENILRELEKLVSYTYGKEVITTQDIEEICSAQITGKIFDMIAAVSVNRFNRLLFTRKSIRIISRFINIKRAANAYFIFNSKTI